MSKIVNLAKWSLTLGKGNQNFLGAKWIPAFLKRIPDNNKRKWALRILNLSPHYFTDPDNPKFKGMSTDEYLEVSFDIITQSRIEICEKVFKKHLSKDDTILEYGCGPGFVAKAISPHVKKIYAIDISTGALACGEIINYAENVEFVLADENGLATIADNSIDTIYSFAVIQHLTDEVFEIVLANCYKKLKKGGKLLLHIQLEDEVWKTEDDWKNDSSVQGKVKMKYGLHCFGRTEKKHLDFVEKHGFSNIQFESLDELANENSSGMDSQKLLTAIKK